MLKQASPVGARGGMKHTHQETRAFALDGSCGAALDPLGGLSLLGSKNGAWSVLCLQWDRLGSLRDASTA